VNRRGTVDGVESRHDGDLVLIAIPLWLVSIARAAVSVARAEVFGAEASLALLFVLGFPWLLLRALFPRKPLEPSFKRPSGASVVPLGPASKVRLKSSGCTPPAAGLSLRGVAQSPDDA
jgi:hypothetical protein